MALLKSVNNVPGIDYYEYRDNQFYGKYKYRLRIKIPGFGHTRYSSSCGVDWVIRMNDLAKKGRLYGWPENKQLHIKAKEFWNNSLKDKKRNYGLRLETSTMAVFSNDLAFLQTFKDWAKDLDIHMDFTEAQTSEFSGVKYFVKEPKNKYRVYFKSTRVDKTVAKEIYTLINKTDKFTPSKALRYWFDMERLSTWSHVYCSSSFFIDYDDESMLSYLALCHGDILGKKYKLEKRP